jgi:hypothetical protein
MQFDHQTPAFAKWLKRFIRNGIALSAPAGSGDQLSAFERMCPLLDSESQVLRRGGRDWGARQFGVKRNPGLGL